jgi:general secretion pathway protein J
MTARDQGFTLVEMLVALIVFGIVATVATALTLGATRSFAATDARLSGLQALERARTLLAADLGQAAERSSFAADGRPMPAFTLTPQGFVIVRRGVSDALPSVRKIGWGFDGEALMRQEFPAVDGAAPGVATRILGDIRGVKVRAFSAGAWRERFEPEAREALPDAIELTIEPRDGEPFTLKFLVAA